METKKKEEVGQGGNEEGLSSPGKASRQTSRGRLCKKPQKSYKGPPKQERAGCPEYGRKYSQDVHWRQNNDPKRSLGNAEGIRHFQRHMPQLGELPAVSKSFYPRAPIYTKRAISSCVLNFIFVY